ncbi:MFS transporter [Desulfospira joergensenii]|uniref:MFS transporter n=1 Tax=Desulfospira joergensenii TaxID=53329 RepID=UPI0003B2E64B|nr:MFS transporter [Desulfospira joergensenii]
MASKLSNSPSPVLWKKTLWIMFFSQLTNMIGFSSIFPFLPFYIESIGKVSSLKMEFLVGLVFSVPAFTMMIISPVWGTLSDRYGRKPMVVRATFGGSLILTLMAFARSAEELVLLRAVQGLVTGTVGAANALVAASVPKKKIGYAMGVLQMGTGLGLAVGPLIGGVVADLFGYRSAFYITGAMLLISGILVLYGVNENFALSNKKAPINFISDWRHVLNEKGVVTIFFFRFSNQLGRMLFLPILPLFVKTLIGPGTAVNSFTGLVVGVTSATMTASTIYLGRLGDRIGYRKIVIFTSLFCCITLAFQGFVSTGWQLLTLQALFGLGFGGLVPGISALLSAHTGRGEEGAVYGLDNSISSAARTLSPLLGAGLAVWFGLRSVFASAALLYLILALMAVKKLPRADA